MNKGQATASSFASRATPNHMTASQYFCFSQEFRLNRQNSAINNVLLAKM